MIPTTVTTKAEFWEHIHLQVLALVGDQTSWVSSALLAGTTGTANTTPELTFLLGEQFGQYFLLGLSLHDGL
jgi:hypothetical protein